MKKHCPATADMFGSLLPEIYLPTIGYLANARGEWHRFCRGWTGFNAVLPISWELGYLEQNND